MKIRSKSFAHVTSATLLIAACGGVALGLTTLQQSTSLPKSTAASQAEADAPAPEVVAIKFHADWCGYCKAMGPVFEELQAKYDQAPALYITFDQTREFNRVQSAYMAHEASLKEMGAALHKAVASAS